MKPPIKTAAAHIGSASGSDPTLVKLPANAAKEFARMQAVEIAAA
jgi:hypothetical protein